MSEPLDKPDTPAQASGRKPDTKAQKPDTKPVGKEEKPDASPPTTLASDAGKEGAGQEGDGGEPTRAEGFCQLRYCHPRLEAIVNPLYLHFAHRWSTLLPFLARASLTSPLTSSEPSSSSVDSCCPSEELALSLEGLAPFSSLVVRD